MAQNIIAIRRYFPARSLQACCLAGLAATMLALPACADRRTTDMPPAELRADDGGLETPVPVERDIDTIRELLAEADIASPDTGLAGHYLASRHARTISDWDAAADFLADALAADPGNDELLRRTFVLAAVSGDMALAQRLASQIPLGDATHDLAMTLLVAARIREGDYEGALDLLLATGTDGLNRLVVPVMNAWALAGAGDEEAALAELEALGEIRAALPAHGPVLHAWFGREDEEVAALEKVVAARGSLRAHQVALELHIRRGDREAARAVIENFRKIAPENAWVEDAGKMLDRGAAGRLDPATGLAGALFDLAGSLHAQGGRDMAMIYAHMALWLDPQLDFAHVLVGDVLADQERMAEALAQWERVSDASPLSWMVRLRKAAALHDLGRSGEAVRMLEAMVAERPHRYDAASRLGDLHRQMDNHDKAISAYDRAIGRLGTKRQEHWVLFYSRAVSLERTDFWKRAEADLKTALELEPDQPFVLNYLAYSWADRGENLAKAREMIARAVAMRPDDGYMVDSYGWVLYRMGEFEEAVKTLEQAVSLRPGDTVINDHLGDAYWQVGRKREARFQWERALALADETSRDEARAAEGIRAKLAGAAPDAAVGHDAANAGGDTDAEAVPATP